MHQSPEPLSRAQQPSPEPTIGDLIRGLRDDLGLLLKQEVALLKAEMTQRFREVAKDGGIVLGGAFTVAMGIGLLLLAGAALLSWLLQSWGISAAAACFTGLAVTSVAAITGGAILAMVGTVRFRDRSLVPEASIEELKTNTRKICQQIQ
ncbi:MAG: hypothetical protein ACI8UO_005214 [Verrucomicrobiales bacterium]|jgi:hypothetical protein